MIKNAVSLFSSDEDYQAIIHNQLHYFAVEKKLPIVPLCSYNHEGMSDSHCSKCKTPGQSPLVDNWKNMPIPTEAKVKEWISKYPQCNIGLILGRKSGIIKIEVFGNSGHEMLYDSLVDILPTTAMFQLPYQNIWNYFFKIPEGVIITNNFANPSKGGRNLSGYKILADGHVAIIPPSICRNGGMIEWKTSLII